MDRELNPLHSQCQCDKCKMSSQILNGYMEIIGRYMHQIPVSSQCEMNLRCNMTKCLSQAILDADLFGKTPYTLFSELAQAFSIAVPESVSTADLQHLLTRKYSQGGRND